MPNLNGKKYAYSTKGIAQYKKDKKKRTQMKHGGKAEAMPKAKPC
tara:strand:- start:456 stop:590 length:135 start_codon:yes stop_codon:yes gene_type:complete